jgi:NitT/TauT family transport system substrate-binding protein
MKRLFASVLAAAIALAPPASAADALRLALQKTGTAGWEIAVIKAFGLDTEAGLRLETTELASPEAGKIALQGGSADLIVSDWLWVARERALGTKLTLYPYSTGVGAVLTKNPAIRTVADLAGRKLGIAGGPLDKSWLLLKAYALKNGVDLEKSATLVFGAPPLVAEKALQGEIDAALEFWNFAIDLEGQGFARPVEIADVEKTLGATGPVVVTGYVFGEDFAVAHGDALRRFFAIAAKARALIATDDKAWRLVAQRLGAKDAATLDLYRRRYVAATPKRSVAEEARDAAALYAALSGIGGEKLLGPATTLPPGTFFAGAP